jgi:hypothetical protein
LAAGITRRLVGSPGTEGAICDRPHFLAGPANHPKHGILPGRGCNHARPLVGRLVAQRGLAISRSGTDLSPQFPGEASPTGRRDIPKWKTAFLGRQGPVFPSNQVSYCRIKPIKQAGMTSTAQSPCGKKADAVACNVLNLR